MKRLAAVIAVALVLAALLVVAIMPAVASAAPVPPNNPNVAAVTLTLTDGTDVQIWANGAASDLGNGGSPALVVEGIDAQVFKVTSVQLGGETFYTHFPSPPPFEPVTGTHPFDGSYVTLTGVFIP